MLRRGFITHIDGIFAPFGNIGPPYGAGRSLAANRPGPTRRAVAEGVFTRTIDFAQRSEAPASRFPGARLDIAFRKIVVGKEFMDLHIALTRQQYAGPGPFEHRDQIGKHITLRIEVLAGLPQLRTLPLPTIRMLVEITPMALPDGDVASGKSPLETGGNRQRFDKRTCRTVGKGDNAAACDLLAELHRIAVCQRDQLGHLVSVGIEFDPRLAIRRRQQSPHRIAHGRGILFAERIIRQADRGMDLHPAAGSLHSLHPDISARNLPGDDPRKRAADFETFGRTDPVGSGRYRS